MKKEGVFIPLIGVIAGCVIEKKMVADKWRRNSKEQHDIAEKNQKIIKIYDDWMDMEGRGKKISDAIRAQGYQKVAIYGMGFLGKRLYERLTAEGVEVVCGIEWTGCYRYRDLYVYAIDDDKPDADMIIVTPLNDYEEIEGNLREWSDARICSVASLVGGMGD